MVVRTNETRYGPETNLLQDLFDGYSPGARPVRDPSLSVNVTIKFTLVLLEELVS